MRDERILSIKIDTLLRESRNISSWEEMLDGGSGTEILDL